MHDYNYVTKKSLADTAVENYKKKRALGGPFENSIVKKYEKQGNLKRLHRVTLYSSHFNDHLMEVYTPSQHQHPHPHPTLICGKLS